MKFLLLNLLNFKIIFKFNFQLFGFCFLSFIKIEKLLFNQFNLFNKFFF